jgi:coiled-coil domain-containing protein 64
MFSPFSVSSLDPDEDIYVLLAQKERDLLLAAEIGQALLEKNEELSKQNEKIAEDFSKKLEVGSISLHFLVQYLVK